jgi:hypothetical protein
MPSNYVITYGDLDPRLCELHGGVASRFGTLIDPNGHKWIICADCINTLWAERQAMNMEPTKEEKVDQAIDILRSLLLGERE